MQDGTREDNATLQLQNILIVMALMDGWIVSVADDSGKQAAFCRLHYTYISDSHLINFSCWSSFCLCYPRQSSCS
jgi:hypothetical protein